MGVQLLRDFMQVEPTEFLNISASRINVYPRGNCQVPPYALSFIFDGCEYFARLEDYTSALGLTTEELKRQCYRYNNPSKKLYEIFVTRINLIASRLNLIKVVLSSYHIPHWENRLYRSLISLKDTEAKFSKLKGLQFGMLRGENSVYLNTGIHLRVDPTMKIPKKGIGKDGEKVVIVKPTKIRSKPKLTDYILQSWQNEVGILQIYKTLQSRGVHLPGILVPRDIFPEKKRVVFDHLDGDLQVLMKGELSNEWKSSIVYQLATALSFLHGNLNIVHRDLKKANILYTVSNGMIEIFLIDWGLSRRTKITNESVVGALGHIPPEYFDGTSSEQKIDNYSWEAWTFGLLLWEIVEGTPPDFYHAQRPDKVSEFHTKVNAFWQNPEGNVYSIKGIARRLMRSIFQDRWTVLKACDKIFELFSCSPKRIRAEQIVSKFEHKRPRSAPMLYDVNNP